MPDRQSAALFVLSRAHHDDDAAMTRRRSRTRERSWDVVVLLAYDDFTDLDDRRQIGVVGDVSHYLLGMKTIPAVFRYMEAPCYA